MAIWLVVGTLGLCTAGAVFASRRHTGDVEPTVREFAEFRDALSQQVSGLQLQTDDVRRRLDAPRTARTGDAPATG